MWYFGEISRVDAEQLINNDGDCLVRYSKNQESHVLTAKWGGEIKHFLITTMFYEVNYPSMIHTDDITVLSIGRMCIWFSRRRCFCQHHCTS